MNLKKTDLRKSMLAALLLIAATPAGPLWAGGESLSYTMPIPPVKGAGATWGRDPFVLPGAAQTSGPAFKLKAIFFSSENPSAIIDNLIVYRGSEIKGQKVIDIGPSHVILLGDYGRVRIDLSGTTEPRDAAK